MASMSYATMASTWAEEHGPYSDIDGGLGAASADGDSEEEDEEVDTDTGEPEEEDEEVDTDTGEPPNRVAHSSISGGKTLMDGRSIVADVAAGLFLP